MAEDTVFAGSIPGVYEQCLVPVLFAPYAEDIVARAARLAPKRLLEIAAGTGVVSHRLAEALPDTRITATDLNPAMLETAATRGRHANLTFEPANAQQLPFDDAGFDCIVIQFGAMFFHDKPAAFAEARRVLAPGGTLLLNVWDRLDANPGSEAIHRAVREALPDPKPDFIARTPFGYCDRNAIEADLRAGGFTDIAIERVERTSPPGSAAKLARGMCLGSPLHNEMAVHPPELRARALSLATEAAERIEPDRGFAMSALVVTAR